MNVYLVQIMYITDEIPRPYNDSAWIDRANAQFRADRLNVDFDSHCEDRSAQVTQIKVQDYEVGMMY